MWAKGGKKRKRAGHEETRPRDFSRWGAKWFSGGKGPRDRMLESAGTTEFRVAQQMPIETRDEQQEEEEEEEDGADQAFESLVLGGEEEQVRPSRSRRETKRKEEVTFHAFGHFRHPQDLFVAMAKGKIEEKHWKFLEYIKGGPVKGCCDLEYYLKAETRAARCWAAIHGPLLSRDQQVDWKQRIEALAEFASEELVARGLPRWNDLPGCVLLLDDTRCCKVDGHTDKEDGNDGPLPFVKVSHHLIHTGLEFRSMKSQLQFWTFVLDRARVAALSQNLTVSRLEAAHPQTRALKSRQPRPANSWDTQPILDISIYQPVRELRLLYCSSGKASSSSSFTVRRRGFWPLGFPQSPLCAPLFVASTVRIFHLLGSDRHGFDSSKVDKELKEAGLGHWTFDSLFPASRVRVNNPGEPEDDRAEEDEEKKSKKSKKKKIPAPKRLPFETDFALAGRRRFYSTVFPWATVCQVLQLAGNLNNREITYQATSKASGEEYYRRYGSVASPGELRDETGQDGPLAIHVGCVYGPGQLALKRHLRSLSSQKKDLLLDEGMFKELVFDYDSKDSWAVRTCCTNESKLCGRCWPLVASAVCVLPIVLKQMLGLTRICCFFSGSKGVHVYVYDPQVFSWTNSVRSGVFYAIQSLGMSPTAVPTLNFQGNNSWCWDLDEKEIPRRDPPRWKQVAAAACAPHFASCDLWLGDDDYVRDRILPRFGSIPLRSELQSLWVPVTDTTLKIEVARQRFAQLKTRASLAALTYLVLYHCFPILDASVTCQLSHMSKLPLLPHATTGRLMVPLGPDTVAAFVPERHAPTLSELSQYVERETKTQTSLECLQQWASEWKAVATGRRLP